MTRRAPAAGWVVLPVLALLAGCVSTAPASAPEATAPAPAPPSPKYHYHAREPVIGAYITTTGTPRAERDGWATGPTGTEGIWYANGAEVDELVISSTKTVTRIVWVLPDGSQRIQQGDLTYYNPETGEHQ